MSTDINQTTLPAPGPIEVTSVKPDCVCLKWGCPKGLSGEQQKFWVTWNSHSAQCSLTVRGLNFNIQDLSPGVKYDVTVATLGDHGNKSQCVSAFFCTGIPEPENLIIETDVTSVSVTWRKPTGLDPVSYFLTLCRDGECVETVSTDALEYTFSNLQTDTEYTISVCTTTLNGDRSTAVLHTINTGNGPTTSLVDSENHPSELFPIEKLPERCRQLTTGNPACYLLLLKKLLCYYHC
ncbi:receptor-type tyrosine-protein phosphatase H-like isoform X2 [Sardina pilchardus]